MNYKVIKYICGCKYILIPTIKYNTKCPKHHRTQKNITIWCAKCGSKVVAIPLAGHKRKVCHDCGVEKQREASKRWNAKHPDYNKVNTTDKYRTVELAETQEQKDIRHFNKWYQELHDRFEPPVYREYYKTDFKGDKT